MITINDRGSFERVGKATKSEAEKLQASLANAAVKGAEEVKRNARKAAATILPRRGGLAAAVSRMDVRVDRKANGCTVQASSPYNIERMNDGTVVHPVYGNRNASVSQSIKPGFWTTAMKDSEPAIQAEIQRAMDETKTKIDKA